MKNENEMEIKELKKRIQGYEKLGMPTVSAKIDLRRLERIRKTAAKPDGGEK